MRKRSILKKHKRSIAFITVSVASLGAWLTFASTVGYDPGYTPSFHDNNDQNLVSINQEVKQDITPSPPTQVEDSSSLPPPSVPASPKIVQLPGTILGLIDWKLTLPTDTSQKGVPDEVNQPTLSTFSTSPYFYVNQKGDGVIFRAHSGGVTTKNSGYPRSELREMTDNGRQRADWSNNDGKHTMTIRQAITQVPAVKSHVVAGQIHDANDDVVMIRLEKKKLFVESDGEEIGVLDSDYKLGTIFTTKIEASDGHIKIDYNGLQKVDVAKSGTGYYFKAGCYTQSNTLKGDDPSAYGEVIIYDLQIRHS